MKISDRYYFYGGRGMGSNSILIDASPKVIVDTGMNPRGILKKMEMDGFLPEEIGIVVNTHRHPDHIGGNELFRKRGAKVLICEEEKNVLKYSNILRIFGRRFEIDGFLGKDLDLKDVFLEVIRTPGHSPDSVCLYDEENRVLISGDTIFPYSVGRWDIPGGDLEALKRSVIKLSELRFDHLLPGHMYPLTNERDVSNSMNAIMEMLGI